MRVLMVILALLLASPVWAEEVEPIEPFEIAMLNLGPQWGFNSYSKGAGGTVLTSHVLLETGDNLAAESGAIITRDE